MAGQDKFVYLGPIMTVTDLFQYSFWIILFGACGIAMRLGQKPERHGMAIMLAGSILSAVATRSAAIRFQGVEIGIVTVDAAVFIGFLIMALRSTRFWPIWVTSFQLIAILTHLGAFLMPQTQPPAYAYMQGFFAYPMLIAILLGAYGYQRSLENRHP